MSSLKTFYMLFIFITSIRIGSASNETFLLSQLFRDYDSRARPVLDAGEQVQVDIELFIRSLKELNTKKEILSAVGWVSAHWTDRRLVWNASQYGDIDFVAINPTNVWLPTFVLGNSASSSLYVEEWYKYFKAKIFSDGTIIWSPGGIFTIECTIDVTYFPFDDQVCAFRFENWVYTGDKVNLSYRLNAESNLISNYIENGQWDVIDVKVMRHDVYYTQPIPYPEVLFGLHFRRKILFYVTNIILLSILIGVLVLHIFKLPPESGEKISMGVTLLLAYSVFILMVNESIPETSTAVPVIIIYLVCIMAVTTLSICESVLVLYCYHQKQHRAPKWLRCIVYTVLFPCFCKKLATQVEPIENDKENTEEESNITSENRKDRLFTHVNSEESMSADEQSRSAIHIITAQISAQAIQDEWHAIARLIDQFSFWLFVSIFLLLILILLIIIPLTEPTINIHESTEDWAGF